MEELKILIVEDDKGKRDDYSRFIKAYNLDKEDCNIIEEFGVDKNDAIDKLKNPENKFDGAIVDLDLEGSGGTDSSGNEVVTEIKENLRFPTFVITGTPQNLSKELNVPSTIFGVFERDDVDLDNVFDRFYEIKRTGILNLLNRNGRIEELIQNIFWNHISTSLDNWTQDRKRTSKEKEDSLLRYTILHMLEYLDEKNYHPSEFYITKPIKESIYTGDIVEYDGSRYIVLTPSCDIVLRDDGSRNTRRILFCKIKGLSDEVKNYELLKNDTGKSNGNRLRLNRFVGNNSGGNFHFIPKHNEIEAGLIDFQDKTTVSVATVERKLDNKECVRLATVSMPFLKDIISRYSNYYARQGSPDFDVDEIFESLFE
ncbi:response regulator [Psychroserpens luteolus]|uniref:response regulator n=1 Tax=Psychroserpens luteolus TaxID=2855840 RepID=UPI001E43467A|nr:response regulator [Psychroserpens luteolus]MCD2260205.1 response regulator [Psychroserpens luteolus]